MTAAAKGGWVLIGDRAYRNSWVPEGTAIRQPACWDCMDKGFTLTKALKRRTCICHAGAELVRAQAGAR